MTSPIPASEFARNFGRYQDQAMAGGVVRVSSHGRIVGGFLSPAELDRFERLKRREREVLVVGALPEDVAADIAAAEYGVAAG
jgi:prevent-host-death family protein